MDHFQELSNNVLRHFSRLNGQNILLCESCLWYDVLESKKGEEIYNAFEGNLTKIPEGPVLSVYGESLPTYIICKNKQVLKLRRSRRIMQIPCFTTLSREDKYSKGENII